VTAPGPVVLLSRSCPPDVGGYQRQLSLVLPLLVADGVAVRAVAARRTGAPGASGWPGIPTLAVPVGRLPNVLRALSDPVLVLIALVIGTATRVRRRRPVTLLLVSPSMRCARWGAVAWTRFLGPVVARYPGSGELRRAGLASVAGVRHVVLSPEQGEEAAAGVPAGAVALVHNAVDVTGELPAERSFRRFVVVGRLIPSKRVDVVVDAWALVAERLPGWRLEVVGSGQGGRDDVEADLRRRAAALPRVTFRGEVPSGRRHLRRDAVVVHCSTVEGVPNTLLEAFAEGAPVVADTAALRRWFGEAPPHVGWDGNSAKSLARVLERVAQDPSALAAVATEARAVASRRWSPVSAVRRWQAVLR
jgi:glycosyltransferase involved in cell wall biosynthesis